MHRASPRWLNSALRSSSLIAGIFLALHATLVAQDTPPAFTTSLNSVTATVGERVTLGAQVTGSPRIFFEWRKNGEVILGATTFGLVFDAVRLGDAGVYEVTAINAHGSARSGSAFVAVLKRPQTITFDPPATATAGSGVTLGGTSSSGLPLTFSLVSGPGTLAGNVLTSPGGNVTVRASQSGNTETYLAAEPVERTIQFVAGALSPFFTAAPADQTVTVSGTATFRVTVIGTPSPTYQWHKDGTPLPGATAATLDVPVLSLADAGRYGVTATNVAGSISASAALTVRAAPLLVTAPQNITANAGERVTFTAAASGFPTPTFQWRRNGAVIAGATNATLTFASVATANAGRYEVVATNALGSATSETVTLTVIVRDFSGAYFGEAEPFTELRGQVALLVRPGRPAIILAWLGPGTAFAAEATVDLAGNFSGNAIPLGTAAVRPPMTIRGAIDEIRGELSGTFASGTQQWTFTGRRAASSGPATARAGYYVGAHDGTSSGRAFAIVAPDGDTLIVYGSNLGALSLRGSLDGSGRVIGPPPSTAVDFTFDAGVMNGTVRVVEGGAVLGGLDTRVGTEHLVNLSVRGVTSNATPLITGFVIAGTTPKQVLIRAAGPTIAQAPFNVAGALGDPTLQVMRGNTNVGQNDEWGTPAANGTAVTAANARAGAFPFRAGSNDAALVATLQPGAHTVMIGGGNGITLAEVYEVLANNEAPGTRRLVNISARGLVSPGSPLIAGFVIAGSAPQRVLIRGIGPALAPPPFNVAGALPNPQLVLQRGNTVVKTNDDWFRDSEATTIRDAAARAGAFALGPQSLDAAILLYLSPGNYTAQVSGPLNANQQNGTGIALVEIYEARP